jgi:hypothetical protein
MHTQFFLFWRLLKLNMMPNKPDAPNAAMRTVSSALLSGLLAFCVGAGAQTFFTNRIGSAQAIKVASRLKIGMSEGVVDRFLETNGLTGGCTVGGIHGGTRFYLLSDGCFLDLEVSARSMSTDLGWSNRILRAAWIQSNDVKITSIALTNRP